MKSIISYKARFRPERGTCVQACVDENFLRATACPLKISTGPKNRCSFLSPTRRTQTIAQSSMMRSRCLTAMPRFAGGVPPDRRGLASGQYPPLFRSRSTPCFCPFTLSFSIAVTLHSHSFTLLHRGHLVLPYCCHSFVYPRFICS